ncbi:MAG: ABC transporter permease [Bdellovibrionota bacterium]
MSKILECQDVDFSYRAPGGFSVDVLKKVSLQIQAGDMIAIRGSSGSGKSTLLYLLGGLLRPDRGSVLVDGEELGALSGDELAVLRNQKIGFVFQQFHLLPRANVLDNILLPASYPCESARPGPAQREKALGLARSMGLGEHLHHLPNQLSGGQQQRVAIARALMNEGKLILADEPTGNLDTKTAAQIMDLLTELNEQGRTIIVITHDPEIARRCQKTYLIRDGVITGIEENFQRKAAPDSVSEAPAADPMSASLSSWRSWRMLAALFPVVRENLRRNKGRSLLTMLGVIIGIASVLAMLTLGQFTKAKILESYEDLGVNKLVLRGWPNWNLKATDAVDFKFQSFDLEKDLPAIQRIFPQIQMLSPVMSTGVSQISYGGKAITSDLRVLGVTPEYLEISNRHLLLGEPMDSYHVKLRSAVCEIGYELAQRLFLGISPIGQFILISTSNSTGGGFACKVIGVLRPQTSNEDWNKPNLHVLMPYTTFNSVTDGWWERQIHQIALQVAPGNDVEALGKGIKAFFQQKYGKSGQFSVDSDAVLIAQMKRFLNLFAMMLAAIAFISLIVGGIGITNMMLVSVSERFKEIGLRKALGATDISIRFQLLLESLALCVIAGLLGIIGGFSAYELLIYGASKLVSKVHFEWIVQPEALILSVVSILIVGIASGIIPAYRAERLQVIEALRSE